MLQADRFESRAAEKFLQIKIINGAFSKIQEIELPSKVGRSPKPDERTSLLALDSPFISREHILIEPESALFGRKRVLITDLGSSNGTFLNGKRIPANARIAASIGDRIQLGALEHDPQGNPIVIQISDMNLRSSASSSIPQMSSLHSQSSSYSQEIKGPTSSFGAKVLAEDVQYLRQELQSARRTIDVYEMTFCILAFIIATLIFTQ